MCINIYTYVYVYIYIYIYTCTYIICIYMGALPDVSYLGFVIPATGASDRDRGLRNLFADPHVETLRPPPWLELAVQLCYFWMGE